MAADITVRAQTVSSVRRRLPTFGLSWRILGLVVVAVMTAEILLFLPSIARFRLVYPEQLIESGTVAALARAATPTDMVAFRRAPEEADTARPPVGRNDEIGVVDREFQNLQREIRASLRQKSRLAEVGAASNKINHDLRNILSTARLLSDRLARSEDARTRKLAPPIMNTIDRATRMA